MSQGHEHWQRIAFFGGSFDPPHLGHLAVAKAACEALNLDRVLFAPVGSQPLKPRGSTAPFAHRVAMTGLAIAGEARFAVSLLDAPDPDGKPNYTLDTLRKLRCVLGPDTDLFFLMGADSLRSLRRWHGAAELPFAATLVVASRPGQLLDDLTALLPAGLSLAPEPESDPPCSQTGSAPAAAQPWRLVNKSGRSAPFYLLAGLDIPISASAIRAQVRAAGPATGEALVPAAVAEYIRSHGLYR